MELRLTRPSERWFFTLVLPGALLVEGVFTATLDWSLYPRAEWVPLVDLCVFLPMLYLICFASEMPLKRRLVHALAIAGLGLLAAKMMVPEANQFVIGELAAVRGGLVVVVLAFEGWVLWKVIGAVYRKGADAHTLERDFAMPQWIAKLMVLEAKFWKAVWQFLRRK